MSDNFSGVCNRKGFGIFINRANGKKYIGLEYSKFIIIISHEVIIYYLKNLINSNSSLSGGDVPKITIEGNHYLFNIKNWNLFLEKFKEGFIKNNIVKKINMIKKNLNK